LNTEKYPYKILFVDDEKSIRDNYVTYLSAYFSEVYQAKDGKEAYSIYKNISPDIMIVDINMPKMNGLELLEKIRENDHATRVIIMTSHTQQEYLLKAVKLKLTSYLIKPVNRQLIKESIDAVVEELRSFTTISTKNIKLNNEYSWDIEFKQLTYNENNIPLTKKEQDFFSLLVSNKNKTFSTEEIIYQLWDVYDEGQVSSIKTLVKNIRKKLPSNIVKNVFGVGYRLDLK